VEGPPHARVSKVECEPVDLVPPGTFTTGQVPSSVSPGPGGQTRRVPAVLICYMSGNRRAPVWPGLPPGSNGMPGSQRLTRPTCASSEMCCPGNHRS